MKTQTKLDLISMPKVPKIKPGYFLVGVIFLLVANYHSFDRSLNQEIAVETADETVARILFRNGIQVTSVPGIYNVKDREKIDISLGDEMRENVEQYDQILYYKPEKILVLYRPSAKSVITVTELEK